MSNSTDFQQEFDKAVRRYLQQPGATVNISFKDANGEPTSYLQALPDIFSQWLEIRCSWDRRSLIYREALDHMFSKNLALWQWAERYLEACYPNEAIQELQKRGISNSLCQGLNFKVESDAPKEPLRERQTQ